MLVAGVSVCVVAVNRPTSASSFDGHSWLWFGGGFIAALSVCTAFALAQGNSLGGMFHALVVVPKRMYANVNWGELWQFSRKRALVSGLVSVGEIGYFCRESAATSFRKEVLIAWLKLAAAFLGFWAIFHDPSLLFQFGPVFIWLVLMLPGHRQATDGEVFLRRLMCFIAILQLLQIYPIAGTPSSGLVRSLSFRGRFSAWLTGWIISKPQMHDQVRCSRGRYRTWLAS